MSDSPGHMRPSDSGIRFAQYQAEPGYGSELDTHIFFSLLFLYDHFTELGSYLSDLLLRNEPEA